MSSTEIVVQLNPIYRSLMSGKFRKYLVLQMIHAGKRVGKEVQSQMRRKINSNMPPPNAPMTKVFNSRKTLIETRAMARAISYKVRGRMSNMTISVGIETSHPRAQVASIVHDGRRIVVTNRMSRLFHMLFLATSFPGRVRITSARGQELLSKARGVVYPLKVGTVLVIPPRPFARSVLEDRRLPGIVQNEFNLAFERTIELAGRGSGT